MARKECLQEMLEMLGVPFLMAKTPVNYTQKGTPYGARVHVDETALVEEDVIGKEGLQETM